MSVLALIVGAAAETGKQSNPILPDKNELFWGFFSFIILVVLLWKFAFPPVVQAMQNRTNRIRKDLDDAERLKNESQTILNQYTAQLQDAKNEANRIIEEARQTADQLRRDLMSRAEAEVAELRQRSQADINAAKDRVLADLRQQVAEIAIAAAERVVERNLDRETNAALVENFIAQVGSSR
ncbi:MAG TPA: F0F1 ATP synthase subunit B [Acidimicrobiales bacterium]|nr:F0F1 ATP synthase subunit B [Acidimicrobiales bacterium]